MRKLLIILLALVTFAAAGCGEESKEKVYLPVMLDRTVISLDNDYIMDTTSMEVLGNLVEGLMQIDKDGRVIPATAESYEVSEDGKTYTFHLREAKWSNGDEVTADDFVFAWRRLCRDANEYAYMFSDIAQVKNAADIISRKAPPETLGVSAPDSKTLVVELETPVSFFLSLTTFHTFYPINEQFFNSLDAGTYAINAETFLSNGAFVLEDYLQGTANIRLRKNERYWDADNVHLDGLMYQVVTSSDAALNAFKNGTLKVIRIEGEHVQNVMKDESLAKNLSIIPVSRLHFLSFNVGGKLANQNLRLAITHIVDRESLVENYVMDGSEPAYTAVPPHFAFNRDTGEDFAADQKKFAEYVSFDREKASSYFELAKTELGAENFELGLLYSNDAGTAIVKVAQAIKAQIEANLPGVKINLQPAITAERIERSRSHNFDIALNGWLADYADPTTFLTLWQTGNANNWGIGAARATTKLSATA